MGDSKVIALNALIAYTDSKRPFGLSLYAYDERAGFSPTFATAMGPYESIMSLSLRNVMVQLKKSL